MIGWILFCRKQRSDAVEFAANSVSISSEYGWVANSESRTSNEHIKYEYIGKPHSSHETVQAVSEQSFVVTQRHRADV